MNFVESPTVGLGAGTLAEAGVAVLAEGADVGAGAEGFLTRVCEVFVEHGRLVAAALACLDPDGAVVAHGAYPEHLRRFLLDQFEVREGPCYECWQQGSTVIEHRLLEQATARWPRWGTSVASHLPADAIVHSAALLAERGGAGAVGLVGRSGRAPSASEVESIQRVAKLAAALVHAERGRTRAEALGRQLERALESRVRIEQAKGAVARDLGVEVDAAFELLRRRARDERRRLHDVATEVVAQLATAPDGDLLGVAGHARGRLGLDGG